MANEFQKPQWEWGTCREPNSHYCCFSKPLIPKSSESILVSWHLTIISLKHPFFNFCPDISKLLHNSECTWWHNQFLKIISSLMVYKWKAHHTLFHINDFSTAFRMAQDAPTQTGCNIFSIQKVTCISGLLIKKNSFMIYL